MPDRPTPRIPKYRLHKPSGLAVVRLNERDIYLGCHGTAGSKAKYEQVIAEWLTNGRRPPESGQVDHSSNGGRNASQGLSLSRLMLAFLEHARGYYVKHGTPTGEYNNIRDALRPVAKLYMKTRVAKFGAQALKTVREEMVKADVSRRVINARVNRIRRMFKWGVENELVDARILHALQAVAPLRKGRTSAREPEPVRPVPEEWIAAVLEHVPRQVAAMIQLQRLTGMRPGEVAEMRTRDLDMSGKIWLYAPESHKTEHHGKNRRIYLGPRAQEVLRPFLKPDLDLYLFSPKDAVAEHRSQLRHSRKTPMTPSQMKRSPKANPKRVAGGRYTTNTYAQAIARGCKKAFTAAEQLSEEERHEWDKEHRWSPNRIRHNAATFLRKEFGIEAARVVLGHSSSVVTEVYAELDQQRASDIMGRVG